VETSLKDYTKKEVEELAYQLGFKYLDAAICPQASFAALQDVFQFRDDTLFKALTGFLGGGGDTCEGPCGGLVGGVAAIGYFFGRTRTEFDFKIWDLSMRVLIKRLYDEFTEKFGGIRCKDVHMKMFGRTFDLFEKKEEELFLDTIEKDEQGGCSYPVAVAASIAAGIIWDEFNNTKRLKDEKYYL
jgi:C_GCAxxG_C_C family probable redox protein